MSENSIRDRDALRAHYGEPSVLAARKSLDRLDAHCRRFIAASPFLVIATADASGAMDASPRGDAPGFVRVPDDRTLVIPDRPGNRRVDSLSNVVANPQVGLFFLVPGVNETLRVNGGAEISTDPKLLAEMAVRGKIPRSALVVTVREAFLHCAKALVRSDLWNADKHVDRKTFPSLGKMLADQIEGVDAGEADRQVQESLQRRLY